MQQITIQTQAAGIAALEAVLQEHGSLAITYLDAEDQPVFQTEPGALPLWDQVSLVALFDGEQELDGLLAWLRFQPGVLNREQLEVVSLEDRQWERAWMQDFRATRFGSRLWICPSWQTPPEPDAVNLMLDPGLAFGSGTHATTALCLEWLDGQKLAGLEVIDYGCGSGVLAIAAALLGAKRVHGVDNDPQAIAATRDNSGRNSLDDSLITAYSPEALPEVEADVLLANILAEPLHELAERFANLTASEGRIVLSGIVQSQVEELQARYSTWFVMDEPVLREGWVRLSGRRKPKRS